MFKQPLKLFTPNSLKLFTGCLRQEGYCSISTEPSTKKWDLISAVCLERHPIITKPMIDLERRFQDTLDQIEFELSYKSNFEIKVEMDKKMQIASVTSDAEVNLIQTAQDFEDACNEEYTNFKFATRTTEADEKNITNSLQRKLDKTLLLLTEQKWGNTPLWLPPQGKRKDGETMRQAAERVLFDNCGKDLTVRFYGNAPVGFYKYLYPRAVRSENSDGAKVFFFLARYLKGSVSDKMKHQWLDREELKTILGKEIRKGLFQFLLPE